jgi:hypothetical protein
MPGEEPGGREGEEEMINTYKDRDHEHVNDERDEECNGRLDPVVNIGFFSGSVSVGDLTREDLQRVFSVKKVTDG